MKFITLWKKTLGNNIANQIFRTVFSPIKSMVPDKAKSNTPIIGIIKFKINNITFQLKTLDDDIIAHNLFWMGIDGFEKETLELFIKLIANSTTILDIGANTGLYSLIASSNCSAKVYAFEPVPKVYERLLENIRINNATNIIAHSMAITNYDGEIDIYVSRGKIPTDSSTRKGFREDSVPIQVPAATLDSFVQSNKIGKVDILKIDTESTENLVLAGAKILLKESRPLIICEVLFGKTETQIHEILDALDYEYYWITPSGLKRCDKIKGDPDYKYLNFLFLPREKKESLYVIAE